MAEVLVLRQYTLHPGRRDELIDLFDREFVETQEAVGAQVLGQFRDRDDDDRFVWLRGYADMATRGEALAAFYGGPVWHEHGATRRRGRLPGLLRLGRGADADGDGRATAGGTPHPARGEQLPAAPVP